MEEIIQYLKELGSIPLVTIPVGAVTGAVVTFFLSLCLKKKQDTQTTLQVLTYINIEIRDNFANRIKSEYPYSELSIKGFDLINMQAGRLTIDKNQLEDITKIYTMFDEINHKISNTRDRKNHSNNITKDVNELKELQNRCFKLAGEYLKKYAK